MKNLKLFGLVTIIVAVLAVAGFAGAKSDAVEAFPDATFSIIYDGYCDGQFVNINPGAGVATGNLNSACASCPSSDNWGGNVVYNIAPSTYGIGWTSSYESYSGGSPFFYTAVGVNGTWTHFFMDGTVLNSGTWSFCTEKVPQGLPRSTDLR